MLHGIPAHKGAESAVGFHVVRPMNKVGLIETQGRISQPVPACLIATPHKSGGIDMYGETPTAINSSLKVIDADADQSDSDEDSRRYYSPKSTKMAGIKRRIRQANAQKMYHDTAVFASESPFNPLIDDHDVDSLSRICKASQLKDVSYSAQAYSPTTGSGTSLNTAGRGAPSVYERLLQSKEGNVVSPQLPNLAKLKLYTKLRRHTYPYPLIPSSCAPALEARV
jgi:hypothetical protein